MKRRAWLALSLATVVGPWVEAAMATEPRGSPAQLRITVVYNNVPHSPGLVTAWGFAAVIATGTDTVLFDTGGVGATLLANFDRLGIDPKSIDAVVLSHIHGDHTGGLDDFLARRPDVTVYLPQSFPPAFRRAVERRGARVETVSEPRRLLGSFYSTGEMRDGPDEQALIVDTSAGLVVVTGCAHPDIVKIARTARAYLHKDIYLLMGGFHLLGRSPARNRASVKALRELGVRKVAPSHCTGDEATRLFREAWGKDFVEGGCGAVIEISKPAAGS
jgi:7,8-dihydropterin-6-yl-methyl-4-(beta-D-ribofuranosyl)aminobenzene 5'-phosphate synthase